MIWIEVNVAAVTVSGTLAETRAPSVAVMFADPTPTALATPLLLTLATDVLSEVHVTILVRFCFVPSLYRPIAVKDSVKPFATPGAGGVTEMDCSTAEVTVSVLLLLTVPHTLATAQVAVIVLVPVPRDCTRPERLTGSGRTSGGGEADRGRLAACRTCGA
jgi:hypothetical protein